MTLALGSIYFERTKEAKFRVTTVHENSITLSFQAKHAHFFHGLFLCLFYRCNWFFHLLLKLFNGVKFDVNLTIFINNHIISLVKVL
jgi:hypothetical protein